MPLGDAPCRQEPPHLVRQLEEPQAVCHEGPAPPQTVGALLLGQAAALDHGREGGGDLDGGEVLPLDVLDEGELARFGLGGGQDSGGDLPQARQGRRTPAPLPGDDAEASVLLPPQEEGLEDAVKLDGRGQVLQPLLVHLLPGLFRVRPEVLQAHPVDLLQGGVPRPAPQ